MIPVLHRPARWLVAALIVAGLGPVPAAAQNSVIRLVGIDMYGGAVWPIEAEPGVAFGARVGLGSLFTRSLRIGLGIDWWTTERSRGGIDVRDIVGHVDGWTELGGGGWFRPLIGLSVGLHSVGASVRPGSPQATTAPAEAEELDGHRPGGAAFAGASLRLTSTGALWLLIEYRYSLVPRVSNHELRSGVRLVISEL